MQQTRPVLPRYQCHKVVEAAKITSIERLTDGAWLRLLDPGYGPLWGPEAYLAKHNPRPGGYYVRYGNGYESWSPAEAFEAGYTRLPNTRLETQEPGSFAGALAALQRGERVCRAGWNGRGMYIELQRPDEHSKMTLPYIFMKTVTGHLVPWLASQTDLLAEDWYISSLAIERPAVKP